MAELDVDCCCEDGGYEAECFASALRALGNRGFRLFRFDSYRTTRNGAGYSWSSVDFRNSFAIFTRTRVLRSQNLYILIWVLDNVSLIDNRSLRWKRFTSVNYPSNYFNAIAVELDHSSIFQRVKSYFSETL